MSILEAIKNALKKIWEYIKKIFVKIIQFVENIANWFRSPERLRHIRDNKNNLPVVIKEILASGNYNVINCLYNQEKEEIDDYQAEVVEGEKCDNDTLRYFGNKTMIVLQ
ncbi:MAG: hypothetical protein K6U80_18650 [Firmicutes bacterium]|nr:hypothetical protein [Bacillota bacterium]